MRLGHLELVMQAVRERAEAVSHCSQAGPRGPAVRGSPPTQHPPCGCRAGDEGDQRHRSVIDGVEGSER